jgi:hypothetical protein
MEDVVALLFIGQADLDNAVKSAWSVSDCRVDFV